MRDSRPKYRWRLAVTVALLLFQNSVKNPGKKTDSSQSFT